MPRTPRSGAPWPPAAQGAEWRPVRVGGRHRDRSLERPGLALLVLVIGALTGLLLVLPESLGPARDRLVELGNLAAAALAAGCAARRARHSMGRPRASWAALAAAAGAWAVGRLLWITLGWIGVHQHPSPADVAFLMFPPLACLALLLHPTDSASRPLRRVLDAAMVTLAVGLVGWRIAERPIADALDSGDPLRTAVTISYPALDLLLLVLTVLTLTRCPSARLPLGLLTAGLLAFAMADITFVYQQSAGDDPVILVDLGRTVGFGCLAVAALLRPRPPRDPITTSIGVPLIGLLPYLPVTAALLLSVQSQLAGEPLPMVDLLVTGALVVLLLARQYLALRQNWALTQQLAQREEQLRHLAFHDGLTGLANRALFRDRLDHAVRLHARDLRPVSLLFLDLDDFKVVNDTLGHAAGDQLLIRVAERLRGTTRSGDTVARLGGDEFAVLLEDGADPYASAQRIADALCTPFVLDHQHVQARVSVGVVELAADDAAANADELLARADTAMYAAKRSGKARIVAHTAGMSLIELEEQRLRTILNRAITEGDIRLAYQPIVDLTNDRRVVAFEALARWQHEDADVPPTTFITAAARTAVLPDLTTALLAEACAQLADWSGGWPRAAEPLSVHVNIAPAQLGTDGFLQTVTELVGRHRLKPGQLVLEITESGLVADLTGTQPVLADLRRAGIGISLDAFGVGYSSLSRLGELELDSVKIERTFLDRIDADPRRAALVHGLLRLAADISLPVIAEGVERPGQLAALERLGCPYGQGYLLGRPAFAAATTARLGLTRSRSSA